MGRHQLRTHKLYTLIVDHYGNLYIPYFARVSHVAKIYISRSPRCPKTAKDRNQHTKDEQPTDKKTGDSKYIEKVCSSYRAALMRGLRSGIFTYGNKSRGRGTNFRIIRGIPGGAPPALACAAPAGRFALRSFAIWTDERRGVPAEESSARTV